MTLSFEDNTRVLCMSIEVNGVRHELCRLPVAATDFAEAGQLSLFVERHGGIDGTLDYMKDVRRRNRFYGTHA